MLQFFDENQKEEIIQIVAKEMNIHIDVVRKDKSIIEQYVKEKCKNDKEEIIKL